MRRGLHILHAYDAPEGCRRNVEPNYQRLNRRVLRATLQAIADEAKEHHEHISGVTRLPAGYTKIHNMACAAIE